MNTQELLIEQYFAYLMIGILLLITLTIMFVIIRNQKKRIIELKGIITIYDGYKNEINPFESSIELSNKLHSYIEESNLRVSTKLFNKLRELGCNNNLVQEIIEFFKTNYEINIYIYGYNSPYKCIGVETTEGSFILHEDDSKQNVYIHGIKEALRIINHYNIKSIKDRGITITQNK